jgi:hypothetical protein
MILAASIAIAVGCFVWAFVNNYTPTSPPRNSNEDPAVIKAAAAKAREEYVALVTVKLPKHFDTAWVMSSRWFGSMGVAIALSKDKYYYWMYSDAGENPHLPYTGNFRIDGDVLELEAPSSVATGQVVPELDGGYLYSSRWKILRTPVSVRLHAEKDSPEDIARTLIMDTQFDPASPFEHQNLLEP